MSEPELNEANENELDNGERPRRKLSIKRSNEALELRERLQKVLATSGLGARRGMEERILKGEITLNGAVPELGAQVKVGDRIGVDDRTFVVKLQEGDFGRVLIYNKPDDEVTTRHDPEGRKTVFENLPRLKGSRWIAVGRLDMNTQGILLFTTNGLLAQKLSHPEHQLEREYLCRIHGEVSEDMLNQLRAGVQLEDGIAKPLLVESMDSAGGSNEWFRMVITEGRNREVRRMWEALGVQVSRLKRARFGNFTLSKGLNRGDFEELDMDAVKALCIELGIPANPSQLIAEDESRRRRSVEGLEGKKRFVAATKKKAEGYWTGERGYGGANVKPQRASSEFDLGSERPSDRKPRRNVRGKGPRKPFSGPMDQGRPAEGFAAPSGERKRRGPDRGPRSDRGPGFDRGPRPDRGPQGPRPDRGPLGPRGPRPPRPEGEGAPRDMREPRGNNTHRRGRREPGGPDIGNRIDERPRRRDNFTRGALGTSQTYDTRYADSEDYGNRIGDAPRSDRGPRNDRGRGPNRPRREFSGPMDNTMPSYEGNFDESKQADGNVIRTDRDGQRRNNRRGGPRPDGQNRGPRPDGPPRGPRPPRPEGERGPRPPRPEGERGPRPPRPEGERAPRPPRPEGERGPRPEGEGPRRNRRRGGRRPPGQGPRPDGGSAPSGGESGGSGSEA